MSNSTAATSGHVLDHRGPKGILGAVRRRRSVIVDAVRSRLWPVPAVGVVTAVIAGVALPEVDAAVDGRLPATLASYLFGGGADAAREVLGAIATSLITVTALTFSLTLITLQLASSQYTPRLLRTFAADRFVQRTLALFLATFAYSLTVLRTVRSPGTQGSEAFVPQIAVTVAYLLAIVSVLALVLFLAHLVRQIRIETMLDHVSADVRDTAHRLFAGRDESSDAEGVESPPVHRAVIQACSSGFLIEIDEQGLLAAAADADAVVWIDRAVGEPLVEGVPVAFGWSGTVGRTLDEERLNMLRRKVCGALRTGIERTATQDIGYGIQQLTDVVIRALSPGINDPTTAVYGLNSCTVVLCELAACQLGRKVLRDEHDRTRVVLARPDLPELLDLVCTQPQRYGARDPVVLARLLSMLRELAWVAAVPAHRRAIADRLSRLRRTVAAQDFDTDERMELDHLAHQVDEALNRQWTLG